MGALSKQDNLDAALVQQLHGTSGTSQGLFAMREDFQTHRAVADGYFRYFGKTIDDDELHTEERRRTEHATTTKLFYNLATDFYEYGWCQSLHFCRFSHGEAFLQAIARHEHYLATQIGVKEGMSVLDVGCGLGGPAREIAKFTDAQITGLNSQIEKARRYTAQSGLGGKVKYVKGDFTDMDFQDGVFDAVYAIEATLHAPRLESVYGEIYRVLKPGGVFGGYEWLLTDKFNQDDPEHRQIALDVQQGNGIAKLSTVSEGLAAMKAAGFEIMHHEDLALRPVSAPWWYPLSVSVWNAWQYKDLIAYAPMSKWGRGVTHYLTKTLEGLRVLPRDTNAVATSLSVAGDALVEAGEKGIFTPMYLILGRKPLI